MKGFGDYILAMERETEKRKILGEDAQEELIRRLQALQIGDIIAVTYYLNPQYPDIIIPTALPLRVLGKVSIRYLDFKNRSHQCKTDHPVESTREIYEL